MEKFYERLRKCAEAKGVNQTDLGRACNLTHGSVSRYFSGDSVPKSFELLRIARYFGVSMEWLLVGEDAREQRGLVVEEDRVENYRANKLTNQEAQEILEKLKRFGEQIEKTFPKTEP